MPPADCFTIPSLVGNPEIDKPPRKVPPNPDSIPIRMTGIPTVGFPPIYLAIVVVFQICGSKSPD